MENSAPAQGTIGKYHNLGYLAKGSFGKVYRARNPDTGDVVALKCFGTECVSEKMQKEFELMRKAGDHKNVLKCHELTLDQDMMKKRRGRKVKDPKKVNFMAVEFAQGGCLFEYVHQNKLSEPFARFFGKQMLQGILHMHENEVCHRDLKPENLLLSSSKADCQLKIADFGEAAPLEGWDDKGYLETYVGTRAYMAPEILAAKFEPAFYAGARADIFSAGIILMSMVIGFHPFNNGAATSDNQLYKAYLRKPASYWKSMQKKIGAQFSPDFIEVANSMIRHDADQRATARELLDAAWFRVDDQLDAEAVLEQLQQAQKAKTAAALAVARTAAGDDEEEHIGAFRHADEFKALEKSLSGKPQKEMDQYLPQFSKNTQYFSTVHPNVIEHGLLACIQARNYKLKKSVNKYKYTFDVVHGVFAEAQVTKMTARILDAGDGKYCVDFSMAAGGQHSAFMGTYRGMVTSKDLAYTNNLAAI